MNVWLKWSTYNEILNIEKPSQSLSLSLIFVMASGTDNSNSSFETVIAFIYTGCWRKI